VNSPVIHVEVYSALQSSTGAHKLNSLQRKLNRRRAPGVYLMYPEKLMGLLVLLFSLSSFSHFIYPLKTGLLIFLENVCS